MAINIEAGLAVVQRFVNNCSYSMYGSRYYTDSTCDCSGSVYRILRESGGFDYGYIPSTETLHDYLTKLGYEKIAENSDFPMQRGDIIIWGQKGYSAGAGGHTGIALDNQNWIECTGWKDTTIIANHDQRWVMAGCPYFYAYRLKTQSNKPNPTPSKPSTSAPTQTTKNEEEATMVCLYLRPRKGGADYYYFNGIETIYLSKMDQVKALQQIYKANNGKDMPVLNWTKTGEPWYQRLEEVAPIRKK